MAGGFGPHELVVIQRAWCAQRAATGMALENPRNLMKPFAAKP